MAGMRLFCLHHGAEWEVDHEIGCTDPFHEHVLLPQTQVA